MPFPLFGYAIVAAAASVAGYFGAGNAWRWWASAATPPDAASGKLKVLVVGPTGVGKTTLIQRVVGAPVGMVGEGAPQTPGVEWLGTDGFPVWFADTKGLEIVGAKAQADTITQALSLWKPSHRPEVAWLCIQADAARVLGPQISDDEVECVEGTEGALGLGLHKAGIPVIVVLTQADMGGAELEAMHRRCREIFPYARHIVNVCADPETNEGVEIIPRHGLRLLRETTLQCLLDSPLRASTSDTWAEPSA